MKKCAFFSAALLKKPNETKSLEAREEFCPNGYAGSCPVFYHDVNVPIHLLTDPNYKIETAQKWLQLDGKNGKVHVFPLQAILPKVQLDRYVPPKTLPRDVEVDRRRRQYEKVDLKELLDAVGIESAQMMPTQEQYQLLTENSFQHFLPMSFFDDTNFDCHSPDAWLKLGVIGEKQYPIPAEAFVPKQLGLLRYAWQIVAVTGYNESTHMWKCFVLSDEFEYEVPKIQIKFFAENPYLFVERLQKAMNARDAGELLIRMETIVDCVLLQDLTDKRFYANKIVDKLTSQVAADLFFVQCIRREIYLLFEHLMAIYEFEKFVRLMPKEFPAFNVDLIRKVLPKNFPSIESASERKLLKSLKLNIKQTRYESRKPSLFYIKESIAAATNVVVECQYIETLNLFVCNLNKPMTLVDFLQAQQTQSTQVSTYLKVMWPVKVSTGITIIFRPLGRGWLDISLDKWSVYEMCKIFKFLLQTKLRMQESMQVLLEKSVFEFTSLLNNPCKEFLNLRPSFKWTSNFIDSMFPYHKPVFSIVISVNENRKVFYSTAPEEFEPALSDVFKKALEKTAGVRQIDAETMLNLRFAPNLYILTTELIEDMYVIFAEILKRSYTKAIIPLKAYARLYERFINFYLLNVNDYIRAYIAAKKPSMQVKQDILEHKRQKEELREILPATITIGPFLINVDPMKQYMIKKHIEIVKRLFEYYVQRMYDINEALLEEATTMHHRIAERPQSIEHLYAIRDFGTQLPDLVEQLRADIQIMWLEYEMLDGFFYNLTDQQFAMKWDLYAWPHKILQRVSTLREEQKLDIEDFKRIHLSECVGFEERLESLNEEVQAFSLHFDPEKVQEMSVEIKKTGKVVAELQKMADVLQHRQALFELEELSVEFLDSIVESFTPYRNLWLTCADFIKLEEATVGNPLIQVELEEVWASLQELRKSLLESKKIFSEKPEVEGVAIAFLDKIDHFVPVYNCILWMRNEHWLIFHWQELSTRAGVEIKYSNAMNFAYLVRKGINEHFDLVQEISAKAESEADSLKKAFEEEERRKREEEEAILNRKNLRKCRRDILKLHFVNFGRIYFDLSPQEEWLVSCDSGGLLKIWDLTQPDTKSFDVPLHSDCCNGVNFHPSLPILATSAGQYHFVDVANDAPDTDITESKIVYYENSLLFLSLNAIS